MIKSEADSETRDIKKSLLLVVENTTPILQMLIWDARSKKTLSSFRGTIPYEASSYFFDLINDLLKKAAATLDDILLLVTTTGPGSFTAIRTALASLRGLSLARKIPLLGMTSFEAFVSSISQKIPLPQKILVLIDSLRDEFFAQFFNSSKESFEEAFLVTEEALRNFPTELLIIGNAPLEQTEKTIPLSLEAMAQYAYQKWLTSNGHLQDVSPYYLKEPKTTPQKNDPRHK